MKQKMNSISMRSFYHHSFYLFGRITLLLALLSWCNKNKLLLVSAATSKNTCHSTLYKERPNNCTKIVVPQGMCVACQVDEYLSDGQFADCSSTMNIQPSACISKLQEYVNLNPCDTYRKDALEKYLGFHGPSKVEEGRQVLDFMAYALCEGGCDCIPQVNADRFVPAISIERGNCQVHFFSDICTIYPDLQVVHPYGDLPSGWETWPQICPELRKFVQSPAASGWPTNPNVTVKPVVRTFLEKLLTATELLNPIVYQYCYDLETAQDRVDGIPYPTISPRPTPPPATGAPSGAATAPPTIFVAGRNLYTRVIGVNCGVTTDYTDLFGQFWGKDFGFNTGQRYVAGGASIPGAMDPTIYKSDRWDPPSGSTLKYTFSSLNPNATSFLVRLHFAELFFPNILSRIFDIQINGQTVLEDLDVVGEAGAWFRPLVKEFLIAPAQDYKITIGFLPVLENPKINGIEIYQLIQAPAPAPVPAPSPVPRPVPAPFPVPAPLPVPRPVPAPLPVQVPLPAPVPVPVPVPAPVPVPVPAPVPAPLPVPVPVPVPIPLPVPAVAPAPVPLPVPVPFPAPLPMPVSVPVPIPRPAPVPMPVPVPVPVPSPVSMPVITKLVLINALSNTAIRDLNNGDTIFISASGNNITIEAIATNAKKVRFDLDGVINYRTESIAPFVMTGDNMKGDYYPWAYTLGSHTLSVKAFNLAGMAGPTYFISFQVQA